MKFLVSAGEVSGDQRGAEVLAVLNEKLSCDVEAFGLGGNQLASQGMTITHHLRDYAVMGFFEILRSLGKFYFLEKELKALCLKEKPDCVILVDYPGFNMRFGRWVRKTGIPVVHYVAPQMWAWGGWRIGRLRKSTDILLTLFAFEEAYFRERGINTVFTGHPLTKQIPSPVIGGEGLGLLPGSRAQEVERLLPVMLQTFVELRDKGVVARALLAVSDDLNSEIYSDAANTRGVELVQGTAMALADSKAALVCSGTATLESALSGVPFVVCYKTGKITFFLAKLLVRGVKKIGLANIIAGTEVAPELIQKNATSLNMLNRIKPLFLNEDVLEEARRKLVMVRKSLGSGDPAENAAGEIVRFLTETDEN